MFFTQIGIQACFNLHIVYISKCIVGGCFCEMMKLIRFFFFNHRKWSAGIGPTKDAYTIGDNPQYRLTVGPGSGGTVWVLLTRHITSIEDFRENKEYITLLVYKNNGQRMYYPCKL